MTNWAEIKTRIANFRNYVNNFTPAAKSQAKFSFLITKDEIKSMLEQAGGAQQLDGIRVYFAADLVENQYVPCIYVVAEKQDGTDVYSDYNIGATMPSGLNQPIVANLKPCPVICPTTNYINS